MATVTVNRTSAALGSQIFGEELLGGETDDFIVNTYPTITTRGRATLGWGYAGARIFRKGYPWTPFTKTAISGAAISSIVLTSSSGAILGRIRSDIEKTILRSISFTLDEHGCADFEMVLNALPDFPLLPLSIIQINVGNTEFDWYRGIVEEVPEEGTARGSYTFKGFGLRKTLSRVVGTGTYPAATDVGLIVAGIVEDIVAPNTNIGFNTGKIDTSTGIFTVQEQVIQEADIQKLMDSYAKMANARWGVDGDGDFYFETRDTVIVKNWIAGYDFQSFDPALDIQNIYNRIKVTRKFNSTESGWTIGAISNDLRSQAKYGIKEFNQQLLGVYSDDDCQIVADTLLAEFSEPKFAAKVKRIPIRTVSDFIERGFHRFVAPPSEYRAEVQDCDDADDWDSDATSADDLVHSLNTSLFVSGLGSIQMSWSDADGASIVAPITAIGKIQKVRCWINGNRQGLLVRLGIGFGSFTQYQKLIAFDVTGAFFPVEFDVSAENIFALNQVGFTVLDSSQATTVLIDRIELDIVGAKHYEMELTTSRYTLEPNRQTADAEFGPRKKILHDYVAEVLARAEENRVLSEKTS
jgi:hypothetical protein